ncbi:hypothetical protein [Streptomyces sp. NPDC002785]|uniref:hypothetical protein n=1 Tax=Streptomyces sp. NPDC002785 TaxID=3154543 RepID=UPI003331E384
MPDRRTGLFRPGLRVKGVRRARRLRTHLGRNGRATWQYRPEIVRGAQHVVWRRISGHDIFTGP